MTMMMMRRRKWLMDVAAVATADNGSDMVVTVAVLCSINSTVLFVFFHALACKPPILPIHARVTRPPCHDASIGLGHIGQMRFRPANTRTILDRIEDITPYCRTTYGTTYKHVSESLRKVSVFKDHRQTWHRQQRCIRIISRCSLRQCFFQGSITNL